MSITPLQDNALVPTLSTVMERYRKSVSILKKGFVQESYRIAKIKRLKLSSLLIKSITSVDIATYRDDRLMEINPKTGRPISPSTVRIELSMLSSVFYVAMVEWG